MTEFQNFLAQGLKESGIDYSDDILVKCQKFYDLLLLWNQKINLTSLKDPKDIAVKHFVDSLICLKQVSFHQDDNLMDVGTGAGFPGVPIKIFLSGMKLTLLDSLEKRCRFLSNLVKTLELKQVDIIHGRAEDKGRETSYREQFSLVTARAVTALPILAEYCLPFLKVGGCFFALKGGEVHEEVEKGRKAIEIMGGEVAEIKYYRLPLLNDARSLVIVKKTCPTPGKYPRKAGIPSKKPIV
ncbi:MAG: 16S rRNA (guanine(527)-N(7))-methyltransferase RsmG [Bacillota bacterium]|nr:16S rRNA (guanine(527)-N(7))-methyltransferase RsmG [Clostridia bacterium]